MHPITPDQLNTYDVLDSDDVVFTREALDAFVPVPPKAAATRKREESAVTKVD